MYESVLKKDWNRLLLSNVSGSRWDSPLSGFVSMFYVVAALCGNNYICSEKRSGFMFSEVKKYILISDGFVTIKIFSFLNKTENNERNNKEFGRKVQTFFPQRRKDLILTHLNIRVLLFSHVKTSWPPPHLLYLHSLNIPPQSNERSGVFPYWHYP